MATESRRNASRRWRISVGFLMAFMRVTGLIRIEFDTLLEGNVRIATLQLRKNRETHIVGGKTDLLVRRACRRVRFAARRARQRLHEGQKGVVIADLHAVSFQLGGLCVGKSVGMHEQEGFVGPNHAVGVEQRVVRHVAGAEVEEPADVVEFGEQKRLAFVSRQRRANRRQLRRGGEPGGLGGHQRDGRAGEDWE